MHVVYSTQYHESVNIFAMCGRPILSKLKIKAISSEGKALLKRKKSECGGNVLPLPVIQKVKASSKLIHEQ